MCYITSVTKKKSPREFPGDLYYKDLDGDLYGSKTGLL